MLTILERLCCLFGFVAERRAKIGKFGNLVSLHWSVLKSVQEEVNCQIYVWQGFGGFIFLPVHWGRNIPIARCDLRQSNRQERPPLDPSGVWQDLD